MAISCQTFITSGEYHIRSHASRLTLSRLTSHSLTSHALTLLHRGSVFTHFLLYLNKQENFYESKSFILYHVIPLTRTM